MPDQQQESASSKPRLLVRACRKLRQVMLSIWGTLIVGILVGTIANMNTTATDTPLSKLYIIYLAQTFPLPVFSSLGILILVTILVLIGSREHDQTRSLSPSQQNRLHMLGRLSSTYDDWLAHSLQDTAWLELGLASKPDAVQNTSTLLLRTPRQPERPLPASTSIVEVYEQANHELLILGDPGTGKSTLLLRLAQHLVKQAKQDVTLPIPVIFLLSTWAAKRTTLDIWLVEELRQTYRISQPTASQWVREGQILPLLDGLDEMEEQARSACIVAINGYHSDHLLPLVVCSRLGDYKTATTSGQLELQNAVVVQALTPAQVDDYLIQAGKPVAALHRILKKNPTLKDLAKTPLMLHILMLTYRDISVQELPQKEALLREQIWRVYIQNRVERKGDAKRYPLDITTARLRWLASQMRSRNQTIFFLEQLQPDWLPTKQRILYRWSIGLLVGLFVEPFFGLFFGPLGGLLGGLFYGLLVGVSKEIKPAETLTWSRRGLWFGLFFGLLVGSLYKLLVGPLFGLLVGLLVGLLFGLTYGLSRKPLTERETLSPNEGIQRSRNNGLLFGLLFGLLGWLLGWLLLGLLFGLPFGLLAGSLTGLLFGLRAFLQHYTLRFWLARSGVFPWKAIPFLEDTTARILLRRVGGGYSFTHRMLLDHFADMGAANTPSAKTSPTVPAGGA